MRLASDITPQLIEDMMALLDNLAVWDVESDGGWKEMARLGLCLLIQYASQPDLQVRGKHSHRDPSLFLLPLL